MAGKNFIVRGGADFSALRKEMRKAQKRIKEFKDNVNKSVQSIGVSLATIGTGFFIKNAVTDAMKFEASLQQLNRLMGESTSEFVKWANTTASAFNMSKSEAVQYGATFSNIISTFANGTKQTQEYTQDLLKATAVASSMTGRSMRDALERIRSGMLGNTEAVEDLGIFVNVAMIESTNAFKRFAENKSWDQLDFKTQQTIRYFAILEQAAEKYGVEVGDNVMSATSRFTSELGNLKLAMGQAFMPIWNYILPSLTAFVSKLVQVMNVVAQFTQALFGKGDQKEQAKTVGKQAGAVSDLGDSYKKAGKEAKKASKSVAGFDEINSIGGSSGSGSIDGDESSMSASGVVGAGSMPVNFDTNAPEVSAKVQAMANKVKQSFGEMTDFIKSNKDIIIASLSAIATGFTVMYTAMKWGSIVKAVKRAGTLIAGAISAINLPIALIVAAIATLIGVFVYFYRTSETFRNKVKKVWKQVSSYIVDFVSFLIKEFKDFKAFWLELWPTLKQAFTNIWKAIKAFLGPIINSFVTLMKWAWPFIKQLIQETMEAIKGVITGGFDAIQGFLKTFAGLFTGDWKMMWEGIKQMVVGVLEFLYNFLQLWGFGRVIGKFFKAFKGTLVTAFKSLVDDITRVFKSLGTRIMKVWDSVGKNTKNAVNYLIGLINKFIDGVNRIKIRVPQVKIPLVGEVGGFTVGLPKIPNIPKLAKGGITNGPTLAMIGDNPGGKEVVSPLDDLTDMIASAVGNAMMAANQFNESNQNNGDVVIQVDGTTLARVLNPYAEKEEKRIGKSMIVST